MDSILDINGKEISVGDKLFCIQGWTGHVKRDGERLFVDFLKWCGAYERTITLTKDSIVRYDIQKVK